MRFPGRGLHNHVGRNAGQKNVRNAHVAQGQFHGGCVKTAHAVLGNDQLLALRRNRIDELAAPAAEIESPELMGLTHERRSLGALCVTGVKAHPHMNDGQTGSAEAVLDPAHA